MVGLSPHTIRMWERRHHLVAPDRAPSRQRRYRIEDVEVIKRVKDLVALRGISLRLATAEALGELPALGRTAPEATIGETILEEGGRWRAVADLDPRAAFILDRAGRVVDGNVAAARLSGDLRFRLPGRRFADLVDPYDRAKAVAIYRGTPQPRRGWELNIRTPAATALFSFDCLPFHHGDEALVACFGSEVDA